MVPAHLRTYIDGTTLAKALKGRSSEQHAWGHTHISGICTKYVRRQGWQNCPSLLRNETVGMTVASIFLGDVVVVPVRSLVPFRLLPFWQCDLFLRDWFPRHGVEQVG